MGCAFRARALRPSATSCGTYCRRCEHRTVTDRHPRQPLRPRAAGAGRAVAGRGGPRPAAARAQRAAGRRAGPRPRVAAQPRGRAAAGRQRRPRAAPRRWPRPTPGTSSAGSCPRLGDGRALLLGELVDADGRLRDLHLKGSGPHAVRPRRRRPGRGRPDAARVRRQRGDARPRHPDHPLAGRRRDRAAGAPRDRCCPGPCSPGSRAATCASAASSTPAPPATSTCCAASPTTRSPGTTPPPPTPEHPYLALFEAVVAAQASLVARWMLVGFVHGVMNTDNMTISGETIDYGPCAFMEAFDPATVYSSIDHGGRYAYGNQPVVAEWNLARLAEALLPLLDDDQEQAVALAVGVAGALPPPVRRAPGRPACAPSSACPTALDDDGRSIAGRRPARPAARRATSTTRRSSAPSARPPAATPSPPAACSSTSRRSTPG